MVRFGGSRLYGTTPVAGYAARLVEKGPAFMRVECRYQYAEGTTNSITTQLNAQGNRVYYSTSVSKKQPNDGWEILLNGLPPLAFQYMPEQVKVQPRTHAIEGWKERAIADYRTGIVSSLVPWGEWTTEFTQTEFFLAFVDEDTALKTPLEISMILPLDRLRSSFMTHRPRPQMGENCSFNGSTPEHGSSPEAA